MEQRMRWEISPILKLTAYGALSRYQPTLLGRPRLIGGSARRWPVSRAAAPGASSAGPARRGGRRERGYVRGGPNCDTTGRWDVTGAGWTRLRCRPSSCLRAFTKQVEAAMWELSRGPARGR